MQVRNEDEISTPRLVLTMNFMVAAGMVAWWSWTQTGHKGPWVALIGLLLIGVGALLLRWRSKTKRRHARGRHYRAAS